jgi:hypothetical protein
VANSGYKLNADEDRGWQNGVEVKLHAWQR